MRIHDVSFTISRDLVTGPGDPAIAIERFSASDGARARTVLISRA